MAAPKVHIVSFDVPYPPDYGGAIDVYYKIKSLSEAGAEIYLHCFQYGRARATELEALCKRVWYYPRITGLRGVSPRMPYIIYSRRNTLLLKNLSAVDAPILFEGMHTTFCLRAPELSHRYKAIRNHNIEHDYYAQLATKEQGFFKKAYFLTEASLLKRYVHSMGKAQAFFSLSAEDDKYFGKLYPGAEHAFIAPFHPYNEVVSEAGSGNYCLYHGNLAHGENIEAALYLLREVFSKTKTPFIIAGRNPAAEIVTACKQLSNCTLIANPTEPEMERLAKEAHIHVLPTFQPTGMKLKLLYALFSGRHVLVNSPMLHGTNLDGCCIVSDTAEATKNKIADLMKVPFTKEDINKRAGILALHYDNRKNAATLLTYLQH